MNNEPSLYLDRGYKFSVGFGLRFLILSSFIFLFAQLPVSSEDFNIRKFKKMKLLQR